MSQLPLSPAQEAAALLLLREAWRQHNQERFRGAMRAPVLSLGDFTERLGHYRADTREIVLSRALIGQHGWPTVIEVLKHEMAHQFVIEVLGVTEESAHGPTFTRVCRERGIDPKSAGIPRTDDDPAVLRIVEKVERLLALAGSANEHEAEAAMRAARRLLSQHNLADGPHTVASPTNTQGYGHAYVGPILPRVHEWWRVLASLLVEHFFVEAIWVGAYLPREQKRGSQLELCGSEANLRIAEYVHGYLSASAPRLWQAYKKREGLRGERERLTYFSGLMSGFRQRLRDDQQREPTEARSRALVQVKNAALGAFVRQRHPYLRSLRYGGAQRSDAYAHGESDGRRLTLRRALGGEEGAAPKLLGR